MSDDVRAFFRKKQPQPIPTGVNVKPPLNAKSCLKALRNDPTFMNLSNLVDAYENIDPAHDQDCSQRMTALKNLETSAYLWFSHTQGDSLLDKKGGKAMMKLMRKVELAHETIVDETKDDHNVVPFDKTGLAPNELQKRTQIWRDLIDQNGHIEFEGSPEFKKRTAAQLGKLLQTKTGTDILDYLSTAPDPAGPNDRILLTDAVPDDLLQNPRIKGDDGNMSYAMELSDDANDKSLAETRATGNEDPTEFPTIQNPGDMKTAILSRAKGVIYNGTKYTFAGGTGSIVKTIPQSKDSEDSNTTGLNDREVIMPPFLTLGHELGHAVNMRSGAASKMQTDLLFGLVKAKNPNMTDLDVVQRWTNPEEFFTITNWEDGLRADAGISPRDAHKTRNGLLAMDDAKQIVARFTAIGNKDAAISTDDRLSEIANLITRNNDKMDDVEIWGGIESKVKRAEKVITNNYIEKFKLDSLKERFARSVELYKAKSQNHTDDEPAMAEYLQVHDILYRNPGPVVAVGTTTFAPMQIRITNNRNALNQLA